MSFIRRPVPPKNIPQHVEIIPVGPPAPPAPTAPALIPSPKSNIKFRNRDYPLYVRFEEEDRQYLTKKSQQRFDVLMQKIEQVYPFHLHKMDNAGSSWAQFYLENYLNQYTSGSFKEVNGTMPIASGLSRRFLFVLAYLVSRITIPLPTDTILVRRIGDVEFNDMRDCFYNETLFNSKTFFSMSFRSDWINEPYDAVISLPKGSPALITFFSFYGKKESEIMLPFNCRFKVTKIDILRKRVFLELIVDPAYPTHFYFEEEDERRQLDMLMMDSIHGRIYGRQAHNLGDMQADYVRRYHLVCGDDCV